MGQREQKPLLLPFHCLKGWNCILPSSSCFSWPRAFVSTVSRESIHGETWNICCLSGNHKMVGARKDLWRSSSQTPLLKQVHLEQVALVHVQVGFEYSPEGDSTSSLGCLLVLYQSGFSLDSEFPAFLFVPIVPYPVTGHCCQGWTHPLVLLHSII